METLFLVVFFFTQFGQSEREPSDCVTTVGNFPVNHQASHEPAALRSRFELIQDCGPDDFVTVLGFRSGTKKPVFEYRLAEDYPVTIYHSDNVLILECLGGSCTHIYAFTHWRGKFSVVVETATKDFITVSQDVRHVILSVPPPTYPDADGTWPPAPPPKIYRLPKEE